MSKEQLITTFGYDIYQTKYRQLRSPMGQVGVAGILAILSDIALDFGEGNMGDTKIMVDPTWLRISTELTECKIKLEGIVTD